jgi:GEVED domain
MQPKFTLKTMGILPKFLPLFCAFIFLLLGKVNAQTYTNGNLSTGPVAGGVNAPAGTTWSELQPGNVNFGFGAGITGGFGVADDFTVPAGPSWTLTKFTGYAYSTGAPAGPSPFNDIRVRIFNTDPSVGNPAPIYGDLTTNRFLASSDALVFRCVSPGPLTNRIIWKVEATINVVLAPGTYWVEWQFGTPLTSNFSPASTVAGTVTQPGNNAYQHTVGANTWAPLNDGANRQDMPFIVNYTSTACAGTPNPGATNTTAAAVCPGSLFTLSLANATTGSGVNYQWQTGTSLTGPWTNAPGSPNAATWTTSLTATTFYRCQVTCSAGPSTGNSTGVQVALNPPSACYCIPTYTNGCSGFGDFVASVTMATLTNTSVCTGSPFYTYYSAVAAPSLIAGATYPITCSFGPDGTQFFGAWIDFNQDGDFVDAGEYLGTSANAGANGTISINALIPATASLGTTRLRIRGGDDTGPSGTQSCGASNSSFGETEDYNVTIVPCVQGAFTAVPQNATIQCSQNASFSVTTTGSALSYSWQYRVNASSPWLTVTNTGIYSGATTTTLTLTNVSQAFTGYQYRALMTGPCTAIDFSSPPATLTVNPLIATVTPTSATICKGAIQQLTLTNATSPTTVTFNNNTALPIPDNTPAGVFSTIAVSGIPAGAIITDVSVRVNITHPFVGDLEFNVIAPNNANMNLVGELDGGNGTNGTDDFLNTVLSSSSSTPISGAPAPRTGTFAAERRVGYGPAGNAQTVTNIPWSALTGTMNGNWRLGLTIGVYQ